MVHGNNDPACHQRPKEGHNKTDRVLAHDRYAIAFLYPPFLENPCCMLRHFLYIPIRVAFPIESDAILIGELVDICFQ